MEDRLTSRILVQIDAFQPHQALVELLFGIQDVCLAAACSINVNPDPKPVLLKLS